MPSKRLQSMRCRLMLHNQAWICIRDRPSIQSRTCLASNLCDGIIRIRNGPNQVKPRFAQRRKCSHEKTNSLTDLPDIQEDHPIPTPPVSPPYSCVARRSRGCQVHRTSGWPRQRILVPCDRSAYRSEDRDLQREVIRSCKLDRARHLQKQRITNNQLHSVSNLNISSRSFGPHEYWILHLRFDFRMLHSLHFTVGTIMCPISYSEWAPNTLRRQWARMIPIKVRLWLSGSAGFSPWRMR